MVKQDDAIEQKIESNRAAIAEIDLASLQSALDAAIARIDSLETLTAAQAITITGLQTDWTNIQETITDHESRITALEP